LPKNSQQVKIHLPKNRFDYFIQNRAKIMDSARVEIGVDGEVIIDSLATEEVVEPEPIAKRYTYRVRSRDNLSTVARKLGVSIAELKRINRIKGSKLKKGQVLSYFKLAKAKQRFKSSNKKRKKSKSRRQTKRKKSKSKKRRKRR